MFLFHEGPTVKMLDFAFNIGITPTLYISICISTLPTKLTTLTTCISMDSQDGQAGCLIELVSGHRFTDRH